MITLKADSGATSHYIRPEEASILTNVKNVNGPNVYQPDQTTLKITKQGTLNLSPEFGIEAQEANILPGLSNASLLSIGKLCNDGCTAVFTKHNFFIIKNQNVILKGHRNWTDGLWDLPVKTKQQSALKRSQQCHQHNINYIIHKDQTKEKLAAYFHASLFSPTLSTLQRAIRLNNLLTFPNINKINFKNVLGPTQAMAKGHLDQEASGLQSTKENDNFDEYNFPPQEPKSHEAIFSIISSQDINNKSYLDITGKFPHTSTRGYQYLLIDYDHDSNIILAQPLKSRQAKEIKTAWEHLYGIITKMDILLSTGLWTMKRLLI